MHIKDSITIRCDANNISKNCNVPFCHARDGGFELQLGLARRLGQFEQLALELADLDTNLLHLNERARGQGGERERERE